ncbi:MAG: aldo/keto reductase [Chitinophaga sp.]|uniref:aldo/keto reductase n=1 Tax=Chitinophaga sp. TaxID=1869181 RepID=UPI001B11F823|nr:aldo/keto reductase [Chitinophaga sp.]MBO9728574.1 aldo/keto reductase [Chitinophaga sp.]
MNLKRIVLGTAGLGGVWGPVTAEHSVQTIVAALAAGIGAIDTAPAYGDAETYVGMALKQWQGKMPVISSKVGRLKSYAADAAHYDYSHASMTDSLHRTLETLGIPALDILFLHDPGAIAPEQIDGIIDTLRGFRESGYARHIGVGGNWPAWLAPYIRSGIFEVVMEFNHLNAANVSALQDSLPFCLANNIRYYAASPLNMGLLGRCITAYAHMKPDWLPADTLQVAVLLQQLAAAHQMSLSSLAHRFLLSIPYDFKIVLGAANQTELTATLQDIAAGPLPAALMKEILNCNKGKLAV